jgi:hypothetical protein
MILSPHSPVVFSRFSLICMMCFGQSLSSRTQADRKSEPFIEYKEVNYLDYSKRLLFQSVGKVHVTTYVQVHTCIYKISYGLWCNMIFIQRVVCFLSPGLGLVCFLFLSDDHRTQSCSPYPPSPHEIGRFYFCFTSCGCRVDFLKHRTSHPLENKSWIRTCVCAEYSLFRICEWRII